MQSHEVFKTAPLPKDPVELQKRHDLDAEVYALFFGTEEERAAGIRLPFSEMPPDAVEFMDPKTRAYYERDKAVAQDPRSGSRFIPHSPVDS